MFTVAVIGPDGSGKTTVTELLKPLLPFESKYVYMGINLEVSNVVFPTTRLICEVKRWMGGRPDIAAHGPKDPSKKKEPKGFFRRAFSTFKSAVRMTNLFVEERFRLAIIYWHLIRHRVVLTDRDFFADYFAHDVSGGSSLPMVNRIHGFMLRNFYRRPDMIICLDVDGETMFARKGEGTPELLEQRRRDYLGLRGFVKKFELVDASRPLNVVVNDVQQRICNYYEEQGEHPAPSVDREKSENSLVKNDSMDPSTLS